MNTTFFRRSQTTTAGKKPSNKVAQDAKAVIHTPESFRTSSVRLYKRIYRTVYVQQAALGLLGAIVAYSAGWLTGHMLVTIILWLAANPIFIATVVALGLIVAATQRAGAKMEKECHILDVLGNKLFAKGGMAQATI